MVRDLTPFVVQTGSMWWTRRRSIDLLTRDLEAAIGADRVAGGASALHLYSRDGSIIRGGRAGVVCLPGSTEQVAACVRVARAQVVLLELGAVAGGLLQDLVVSLQKRGLLDNRAREGVLGTLIIIVGHHSFDEISLRLDLGPLEEQGTRGARALTPFVIHEITSSSPIPFVQ